MKSFPTTLRGVVLALLLLPLLPGAARACAVCFDTTAENRMAFMLTTVLLSLLPLGMVGGAGVWLRRRSRELDDEKRESPED